MKIVVLKENESVPRVVETKEITLELLQKEVGGYIEAVPAYHGAPMDILRNQKRFIVWCDEEGLLKGKGPNIFWTANAEGLRFIVGDVVVTGKKGEDTVSVADEDIPKIIAALNDRRYVLENARKAWKEKPTVVKGPWKESAHSEYTGEGTRALVKYKDKTWLIDVRWTADNGNEALIQRVYPRASGGFFYGSENEVFSLTKDGEEGMREFMETFDWDDWEGRQDDETFNQED